MRDLYQTLGVRKNAKAETIRQAYRKRAADLHPDRNLDDEAAAAEYKAVTEAYRVLSDPERRRRYDATGDCTVEPDNRIAAGGHPDGRVPASAGRYPSNGS